MYFYYAFKMEWMKNVGPIINREESGQTLIKESFIVDSIHTILNKKALMNVGRKLNRF